MLNRMEERNRGGGKGGKSGFNQSPRVSPTPTCKIHVNVPTQQPPSKQTACMSIAKLKTLETLRLSDRIKNTSRKKIIDSPNSFCLLCKSNIEVDCGSSSSYIHMFKMSERKDVPPHDQDFAFKLTS